MFDFTRCSLEMANARVAMLRRDLQMQHHVQAALAARKAAKADKACLRQFRLMYKVRHFLFRVAPRFASRLTQ